MITILSFVDMLIGFSPTTYTAFESDGYVEVCVDVLIPGEALRNFTAALIPEEGIKLAVHIFPTYNGASD